MTEALRIVERLGTLDQRSDDISRLKALLQDPQTTPPPPITPAQKRSIEAVKALKRLDFSGFSANNITQKGTTTK